MKIVHYTLTLLLFATIFSVPSASAGVVKVFLLGGQSNADGNAEVTNLPSYMLPAQTNVDFYHSGGGSLPVDQIIDLQPGGSNVVGRFGPELTFGQDMASYYADDPDTSVAIIKYAVGGTNLYSQWAPGGNHYNAFNNTVTDGLAALAAKYPGDEIDVAGMIWMQGEADLQAGDDIIAAYDDNLTNFIANMRSTYNANMPFVIGQLSDNQTCFSDGSIPSTVGKLPIFKAAQASVAAADPLTGLVVTDTFTTRQDETYVVHFDAAGQMALGSGFASEMQNLTANTAPKPSTVVYQDDFETGYTVGDAIGQQGWTEDARSAGMTDATITPYSSSYFSQRLLLKEDGGRYPAVHKTFSDTPLTGEVELWVDVATTDQAFLYFTLGDATLGTVAGDWDAGMGAGFGIHTSSGVPFILDGTDELTVAFHPTLTGLDCGNKWFRFHMLIDVDAGTQAAEIFQVEQGGGTTLIADFDSWVPDTDGLPDLFDFRSPVTGLQAIDVFTIMQGPVGADASAVENISIASVVEVPERIPGDANGDKKVDGSDVTILAGNWQAGVGSPDPSTITWAMGDFNGDGQVDGSDVTILAGNWQAGVTAAVSAVPEPNTIVLLLTAIAGLFVVPRLARR